jgi:4-diphosphocytidyl-2-C-methyl-D-erythritol kinase
METTAPRLRVQTPAKLNLTLQVLGRRPDGYHEILSIMTPVGLFDDLEVQTLSGAEIRLRCEGIPSPQGPENLVFRAAQNFQMKTGTSTGLGIRLFKRIPVAAGLGGGSSDAAATLLALNQMHTPSLPHDELARMAVSLGADVPFFLDPRPSVARGIGEILDPIENFPKFWYVIVVPPLPVSTSWAYSQLGAKELTPVGEARIILNLGQLCADVRYVLENDLEIVTASQFPVIHTIKKALEDAGAEGTLMSGSGPSVFGVFRSRDPALRAKSLLLRKTLGDVFAAEGL